MSPVPPTASSPRFHVVDVGINALTFEGALATIEGWINRRERH